MQRKVLYVAFDLCEQVRMYYAGRFGDRKFPHNRQCISLNLVWSIKCSLIISEKERYVNLLKFSLIQHTLLFRKTVSSLDLYKLFMRYGLNKYCLYGLVLYTLFFSIRIYFIRISRLKFANFKNILRIKPRLRYWKGYIFVFKSCKYNTIICFPLTRQQNEKTWTNYNWYPQYSLKRKCHEP